MALTTEQEAKIALLLEAFDGAKSIGDLTVADSETLFTALMEVVQGGVSKQASIEMIAQVAPVAGLYPDVPINRVTIKRYSGQLSPLYVYEDNTSLMAKILTLCKPVLLNRDSLVDTYLSGSNCLKSADGYPANLTAWDKPAMTQIGGFWQKYEYNASTNEKSQKSPLTR